MLTKPLSDCLLTFHLSPFNKENKNGKWRGRGRTFNIIYNTNYYIILYIIIIIYNIRLFLKDLLELLKIAYWKVKGHAVWLSTIPVWNKIIRTEKISASIIEASGLLLRNFSPLPSMLLHIYYRNWHHFAFFVFYNRKIGGKKAHEGVEL